MSSSNYVCFSCRIACYTILFAVTLLTGCSDSLDEGVITEVINEAMEEEKTCFSSQDKGEPTWPLRVDRPEVDFLVAPLDPILIAMQAAGHLNITHERQKRGFYQQLVDVIMPTEEAEDWWDANEGFCVGERVVAEIKEWTPPGEESVEPVVVNYTWHLDAPSWAKRPEFKDIKGMTPIEETTALQKTSDGWKITTLPLK